jgi:hypothetical protein
MIGGTVLRPDLGIEEAAAARRYVRARKRLKDLLGEE